MKKIVCFVLMAVLLVTPVYASDIDLSSLSDEELQELQARVGEEITNRELSESVILQVGTYYVGTDIAPGSYIFSDAETDGTEGSWLLLYENEEKMKDYSWFGNEVIEKGDSARVSLSDGQILKVTKSPAFVIQAPTALFES